MLQLIILHMFIIMLLMVLLYQIIFHLLLINILFLFILIIYFLNMSIYIYIFTSTTPIISSYLFNNGYINIGNIDIKSTFGLKFIDFFISFTIYLYLFFAAIPAKPYSNVYLYSLSLS